jgi:hypothetical protein
MGISLFGLTPAATYPALIKFGDNSAISGTLRALSDGLGNDLPIQVSNTAVNFTGTVTGIASQVSGVSGAIQFSNGSAFASDAANFFWDDTNKRLGVGTNAPSSKVYIQGTETALTGSHLIIQGTGTAGFAFADYSVSTAYSAIYPSGIAPASRSFTNYLLISDLNGTDVGVSSQTQLNLKTSGLNRLSVFSSGIAVPNRLSVGQTSVNIGAQVYVKGSGSTSATTSLLVQNSAGTDVLKVTDDSVTNARGTLNVLHPSVATRSLQFSWGSIFATDSASELTIGAVWTVPSAPQILLAGNTRGSGANTMQLQASAGVSIATSLINPTAQLHIKGSGSTSATTSLLVQNSAGNNALQVRDDLRVIVPQVFETGEANGFTFNSNVMTPKINGFLSLDRTANREFRIIDTSFTRNYLIVQSSSSSNFADISFNTDHLAIKKEGNIGIGETTPTARLQVKGSGSTSATTSLLVQNSAGTAALRVTDDRIVKTFNGLDLSGNYLYANGVGNASIFGGTSLLFDTTSGGSFRFRNGSMALGVSVADATAHLDVQSTTKGFLPPRMTTTQKNAIASPAAGLQVFDTTFNQMSYFNGTVWINF